MVIAEINTFLIQVWERSIQIILAPKENPEITWLLIPLIITILLMEFYFGRYSKEELGWNTAYGNSLVLLFIAAFLFKYIHENDLWIDATKMAIMAGLIFAGLVLTIVDFFHLIPKQLAFKMSSKLPINYLAYVAIVLIYIDLPLDYITIVAFVAILLSFSISVWFARLIAPKIKETIHPSSVPEPAPEPPEYKETT